jgi:hypothetical protein
MLKPGGDGLDLYGDPLCLHGVGGDGRRGKHGIGRRQEHAEPKRQN